MNDSLQQRQLSDRDVQIWRETMEHLRHLSGDVFKSMTLFLGMNALLLGAVIFLGLMDPNGLGGAVVCLLGIFLTLGGRFMLKRHRIYYLEMLAKKSLLEKELGFYDRTLAGSKIDLALPWRLKPEVVAEIAQNCEAWIEKSIRLRGTMARVYFLIY